MPIGSIYLSLTTDNPTNLFGGVWERIKDTFLLAAGDTYTLGGTGGASTHAHTTAYHILTINEIPSHIHNMSFKMGIADSSTSKLFRMSSNWNTSVAENEDIDYPPVVMGYTGGSQGHNHGDTYAGSSMPPYLAVYIWKRIS